MENARSVYYDQLRKLTEMLISEDRDFYQAQLAALEAYGVDPSDSDIISKASSDFEENAQQVRDGIKDISAKLAEDDYFNNKYMASGQTQSNAALASAFASEIETWYATYSPSEGNKGNYPAMHEVFMTARNYLSIMEDSVDAYSEYQDKTLRERIYRNIAITFVIILIAIVALYCHCMRVIKYIRESVRASGHAMDKLSQGEFVRVDKYLDYEDGLGRLIKSTNAVVDKLEEIVTGIRDSAQTLLDSSNSVANTAEQITGVTNGIANAVNEIAEGSTQQANEIQNSTENAGKIGDAIGDVTQSTNQLDSTANIMQDHSITTADQLKALSKSSDDMAESIAVISDKIGATSAAVERISNKVAAINQIATQTNLLSLNASIEAARAGEAGRGFVVVAEEIGKLAEDSGRSAEEIRHEMNTLLAESQAAVAQSQLVMEATKEQKTVLDSTITSVNGLLGNITTTVTGVKDIMKNAQICEEAKNVVVDAMSGLSAISEENAASTEETSASMQELNLTAVTLSQSAESLRTVAQQLEDEMAFFK